MPIDYKQEAEKWIKQFQQYGGDFRTGNRSSYYNAKFCALIMVNEILNLKVEWREISPDFLPDNINGQDLKDTKIYWLKLKEELEK
jgi:hypothetical protein